MIQIDSVTEMHEFAMKFGSLVKGGEIIELVGDVGAGKTTFVRGFAIGMGVDEQVQSPSFTINRVYNGPNGLRLVHYDFYRLSEPGIMADELLDTLEDKNNVVVIEWADSVMNVLPKDRLHIQIEAISETSRRLRMAANGATSTNLLESVL